MPYTIEEHKHRFAAWAASTAARVKGCRFSVEQGKAILEEAGLCQLLASPDKLPVPEQTDSRHRDWRVSVLQAAEGQGLRFTHGVAAKLINVYLKAVFVCGGHHDHESVRALHPPVDGRLLKELAKQNLGGLRGEWNKASRIRWSNLDSEQYEKVIHSLRVSMTTEALWKVEQHWRGYQ